MPEASSFGIVDLYVKGWELLKATWKKVLVVGLVFFVIEMLVQASLEYVQDQQNDPLILLIYLVSLVVGIILQSGIIAVGLRLLREKTAEVNDLFNQREVWFNFFLATLGYQVLMILGFILLIVPGIYWMIKYSQVSYLVVDKKMGVEEAFGLSGRMTKGVMLKILGFWLLAIPINLVGALALGVGLLVTIPVTGLAQVYLYQTLVDRSGSGTTVSDSGKPEAPTAAKEAETSPTKEAKPAEQTDTEPDANPPTIKL